MKLIITILLLLTFSTSFSQWTRVEQLPASNIFSLFHKDSVMYAGGTNVIYISRNKGLTWNTSAAIPQLSADTSLIRNIIVYKNELYISSPREGVFKSPDGGTTWQDISAGIPSSVSDFCEYKGELYATTDGTFADPIHKLDPVNSTHWLSFSNGLTSISTVINSIVGNSNVLIAGANNNSLIDCLPANETTWEERSINNPPIVNEGVFDIITAHDTLFYAGKTGFFYMSTDNGLTWNFFGNRLVTGANFLINAKEAMITSRYIFNSVTNTNNSLFYYIKKDSLQFPFHNFSVVPGIFTWNIDILGGKLWDATDKGLFYMSLTDLPGITAADDSLAAPLPVHFALFKSTCERNKLLLNWKTTQEQNTSRFDIERSADGFGWTVIGNLPAAGNSNIEKRYSFTDNNPGGNNFYRIAEHDLDGRVQYTSILRSSCIATEIFNVWPNPVQDIVSVNIVTDNTSQATLKIFDSKGTLVKIQAAKLLLGSNILAIDLSALANGAYSLAAEWNDGNMKKTIQVIKK